MKEWTQEQGEAAIARLEFLTSQRGALRQFSNGRKTGYAKWAVNVVAELNEARDLLEVGLERMHLNAAHTLDRRDDCQDCEWVRRTEALLYKEPQP